MNGAPSNQPDSTTKVPEAGLEAKGTADVVRIQGSEVVTTIHRKVEIELQHCSPILLIMEQKNLNELKTSKVICVMVELFPLSPYAYRSR
jgi:hypothetical protein